MAEAVDFNHALADVLPVFVAMGLERVASTLVENLERTPNPNRDAVQQCEDDVHPMLAAAARLGGGRSYAVGLTLQRLAHVRQAVDTEI